MRGLLREARISGALEHPNIVPVHLLGQDDEGRPVLVMKRIEGVRWSKQILGRTAEHRLDPPEVERHLAVLLDVCNAVHYAHSRGIVHRDIKPENVLIGGFGEVVLFDWGVAARLGEPPTGVALGTPGYMAPEMVEGAAPDVRTDVYLLGATLHRILTGRARHHGKVPMAILRNAWLSEPWEYEPSIPQDLGAICNKATSKDLEDRYPDVLAFRAAIEDWQRHSSSRQLARAARAQITELEQLLDAEPKGKPGESVEPDRRITDLASAARFGLRQALETWPDNPDAREAMEDLLMLMVPYELRIGQAEEAHAMFEELSGFGEYNGLGKRVQEALRRERALQKLGRELDMTVSGGSRVVFLVGFGAVSAISGVVVVGGIRSGIWPLDHFNMVAVATFAVISVGLAMVIARRWLMPNVASRRVMYSVWLTSWAIWLHRMMGWALDMDPNLVVVQDLGILALGAGVAGVGVARRVLVVAVVFLLFAAAATAFPAWGLELFSASVAVAGMLLAALFLPWFARGN